MRDDTVRERRANHGRGRRSRAKGHFGRVYSGRKGSSLHNTLGRLSPVHSEHRPNRAPTSRVVTGVFATSFPVDRRVPVIRVRVFGTSEGVQRAWGKVVTQPIAKSDNFPGREIRLDPSHVHVSSQPAPVRSRHDGHCCGDKHSARSHRTTAPTNLRFRDDKRLLRQPHCLPRTIQVQRLRCAPPRENPHTRPRVVVTPTTTPTRFSSQTPVVPPVSRSDAHPPTLADEPGEMREKREFSKRQLSLARKVSMSCRHCNEPEKDEAKDNRRKSLDGHKELKGGEIRNKGAAVHQSFKSSTAA